MVSIIMPAYKSEHTISDSIASVCRQTYKAWELIIVADDSGDKTINSIPKDTRIKIVRNATRLGVAESRNKGVELASGEWIAFLDSDDIWREDKLYKQLNFMRAKNARISYTASAYIGSDYIMRAVEELDFKKLLRRNIMSCSSIIVERELALKYPFPNGVITEDFAVWLAIVKEGNVAYGLDEPLLFYRLSANSDSSGKFKMAVKTYRTYRHLGVNPMVSALLIFKYALYIAKKQKLISRGIKQYGLQK